MAQQGIKMTAPAGEPAVVAAPPVPVAGADVLGSGGGGCGGVVIDAPSSEHETELADVDLTDDDFSDEEDDDDSDDEYVDSDSEFEDDDGQPPRPPPPPPDVVEHSVFSVASVGFLGQPARFATVHNTAAFMRLAPAAAAPGESGGGGEIVVHYRYTRFLRAQGACDSCVDTHVLGPKLARVRFHLPAHAAAAADPASSVELAGAAVVPLLYPARFSAHLRALWCHLVAMAPVPRATRVVVTVDAGILRPGDWTPARMRRMVAAMESVAREGEMQPAVSDVCVELRLPAPLAKEDDVRPAKRRRVAGEDCPICCEALEQGLAAWPRCLHIFHATCLEEHLVRGSQECPMCRNGLEVVDAPSME
ncbi:unnamed protein product [Urochloa decumbens]|uniref:RING-type domain-containing protein n=1 Tax=Urochloa decumbens TaxID=240449 RepID=A0ABC9AZ21_9POAL